MINHNLRNNKKQTSFLKYLILILLFIATSNVYAQQGVIASCYYHEKVMLQKMWKAREAGDNDQVASLSLKLKAFVEDKKSWAESLIKLTNASIEKVRKECKITLTDEELEAKNEEIREIEGQIRALYRQLECLRLDFSRQNYSDRLQMSYYIEGIRSHREEGKQQISNLQKKIVETDILIAKQYEHGRKALEELRTKESTTKFPKEKIYLGKCILDVTNKLASGDYSWFPSAYTINQQKDWNKTSVKQIAKTIKELKDGTYCGEFNIGHPINYHKGYIKHFEKVLAERKEQFTSENWHNMRGIRKQIQALRIKLLKLQAETGSSDSRIVALQTTKDELQKLIDHNFLTELPKEESIFLKAIKWCEKAAKKVMNVIDSVKEVKVFVDILNGVGNPVQAFDMIYEKATGKSMYLSIAKKAFPSWITKSGAFKLLLRTGKLDKKMVLEEFASKNISKKLTKHYMDVMSTINELKHNPEGYLKSKAYDKVQGIIDANPELKRSMKTFEDAKLLISDPSLISEKLEERIKSYATDKFASTEFYGKLKNETEKYENKIREIKAQRDLMVENLKERVKKIKEDGIKDFENFKKNIITNAIKDFGETMQERVGLKDEDGREYIEMLLRNYSFLKTGK